MKLKQYIKENNEELTVRTNYRQLNFNECIDLIKQSYNVAFNNKHYIYRGIENNIDCIYVNPKLVTRRSAYASENYYTELLDSFKSWQDYPKRSKSLICTNSLDKVNEYTWNGNQYIVLPHNNANLAIAPNNDIWYSFKLLKNINVKNLSNLNSKILLILNYILDYLDDLDDLDDIVIILKKVTKKFLNDYDLKHVINNKLTNQYLITLFKESNYHSLYDYLEHLMDPKLNEFKLIDIKQFDSFNGINNEIWTSDECILIKETYYHLIKDKINNEV